MITVDDFLIVQDKTGKMFRLKLSELSNLISLNTDDSGTSLLEAEIENTKEYILDLSADFIENHYSIAELNQMYEQKVSTDYLPNDVTILDEDQITRELKNRNILILDEAERAYDALEQEAIKVAKSVQSDLL